MCMNIYMISKDLFRFFVFFHFHRVGRVYLWSCFVCCYACLEVGGESLYVLFDCHFIGIWVVKGSPNPFSSKMRRGKSWWLYFVSSGVYLDVCRVCHSKAGRSTYF